MKFIINNNTLTIKEYIMVNSGSISNYEIPVEFDESWNGLTIVAKICKARENTGIERAVINNKVFIDIDKKDRYAIGFVGYIIENNKKIYQKSTNLKVIPNTKGAGEIDTTEESVPTPSEWEMYIAQIEEMLADFSSLPSGGTTGQILSKKSNDDGDVEWTQDIHLSNAYLENNTEEAILVLEMNNGTSFRVNLGNLDPSSDIYFITKDDEIFITKDSENFILKEEE